MLDNDPLVHLVLVESRVAAAEEAARLRQSNVMPTQRRSLTLRDAWNGHQAAHPASVARWCPV